MMLSHKQVVDAIELANQKLKGKDQKYSELWCLYFRDDDIALPAHEAPFSTLDVLVDALNSQLDGDQDGSTLD